MGIRHRILQDHRLAVVVADGEPVELTDRLDELLADQAFRPGYCILIDVRRRDSAPTTGAAKEMVRWLDERGRRGQRTGRVAMLVSTPGQFGMGRMAELQADVGWFRVFDSVEEAEAWLGERARR